MDGTQKKALVAVGGMLAYCAGLSVVNFRDRRKFMDAVAFRKEYLTKYNRMGTIIELFDQMATWSEENAHIISDEAFFAEFLQKAEYISVVCKAFREDISKPEEA